MKEEPFSARSNTQERLLEVRAELAELQLQEVMGRVKRNTLKRAELEAQQAKLELVMFRLTRDAVVESFKRRKARRNSTLGHLKRLLNDLGMSAIVREAETLAGPEVEEPETY